MADQARLVVQKNGAGDKITILKQKAEDVQLPERVDVIVSEWMGYCLLYVRINNNKKHAPLCVACDLTSGWIHFQA